MVATICKSKALASDQVIKSEIYFYISMGFILFFKSQHQVTAAGEINLMTVPRDVVLQELMDTVNVT